MVTSVNKVGGGTLTFIYDENGNVKERGGDDITYNAFNKPIKIHNPATQQNTEFTYGADLMRYRQITPTGSTIYYLDKLMEIEATASSVDYRHYLGDLGILTKTGSLSDPNPGIDYFFRDRLGGISMIGDETGLLLEYRAYDAFGKPRNSNWSDKSTPTISSTVTDRGFTDHEHLDDWQLIHMNGRAYDYNFGRFLSVDPFIQDPGNSQSINAYAYIMNNPLSGTDPTGYSVEFECAVKPGPSCTSVMAAEYGRPNTGLNYNFGMPGGRGILQADFEGPTLGKAPNNGRGETGIIDLPSNSDGAGSNTDGIGSPESNAGPNNVAESGGNPNSARLLERPAANNTSPSVMQVSTPIGLGGVGALNDLIDELTGDIFMEIQFLNEAIVKNDADPRNNGALIAALHQIGYLQDHIDKYRYLLDKNLTNNTTLSAYAQDARRPLTRGWVESHLPDIAQQFEGVYINYASLGGKLKIKSALKGTIKNAIYHSTNTSDAKRKIIETTYDLVSTGVKLRGDFGT